MWSYGMIMYSSYDAKQDRELEEFDEGWLFIYFFK